jgi:hypothetical protein
MSNRAYLYSLSNRPTSYADRPETISGLSEWSYAVPFTYRVLMSGNPQLCRSLISDGFDSEPAGAKTKLYAVSGDFDVGLARLKKFFDVVRGVAAGSAPDLVEFIDPTVEFLETHRDRYLLLETVELDTMQSEGEAALRACVEKEMDVCRRAGAAVDALTSDASKAGTRLSVASKRKTVPPLDALYGLNISDDFDAETEYPLGLSEWSEVLYYQLWNKAKFDAEN